MTIGTLPARADIWAIADTSCTPLQLRVLQLRELHGFTWNDIAYATGKHHSTVRGHYRAAVRNIALTLEKADR